MKEKQVIVKYMGGLGNQMFQYAIGEMFKEKGYKVLGDLRWYKQEYANRDFLLHKIFSNVSMELIEDKVADEYEERYRNCNFIYKVYRHFVVKNKLVYYEKCPYAYDRRILKIENALIEGYWQSYKYCESIREKILQDFTFPAIKSKAFIEMKEIILENNIGSVHIRGGDYQTAENKKRYGEDCNIEYYLRAIGRIEEKDSKVIFWGFTDDLDYAKRIIDSKKIVWFDKGKIEGYEDWMDMYLMSLCKYNILANSSFSWWAAYLNQNSDRVVIAPKQWYNLLQKDDICPEEWIRL